MQWSSLWLFIRTFWNHYRTVATFVHENLLAQAQQWTNATFPPPPFFFPSPSHMDSNSIWNIQAHLQKLLASAAYCMDSSVLLWGGAQRDMPCVVMVEVLFLTFVHDVPDRRSYSLKNAFCARLLHSGTGLLSTIYLKEPWNKLTRGRQRLQCCSTNVRELGCADAAYLWTWPVLGEEHCMQHCLQGCWITSMLRYPPPSFFFFLSVLEWCFRFSLNWCCLKLACVLHTACKSLARYSSLGQLSFP